MNTEYTSTKTKKITLILILLLVATLTVLIIDVVQNHSSTVVNDNEKVYHLLMN